MKVITALMMKVMNQIMNDTMEYEDIVKEVAHIEGFKQMVQSDSKRPIAVRVVVKLIGISEHEAWEFIDEYYSRMDINLKRVKVIDGMFERRVNK